MGIGERWRRALEAWRSDTLAPTQARFGLRDGVAGPGLHTPLDLGDDSLEAIGLPGQFPYTRGVQPTMYRGRLWTMRQYAGFGTAAESNARYRYLLERGTTGLSVAFDLPTQMGFDSDHDMAAGEVGRVGVAIDSLADMEVLLEGLPLDRISTSMTINSTAPILLALYMVVAEGRGVPPEALRGTVQNDVLKEYIARGTYIHPPGPSLRLITDLVTFCAERLPQWNPISISGYHIREAGSTAVQELAFTLADGLAYVQAVVDAGMDVDRFAPRLSFFFNVHSDFLEEVAKFRAARRMWARLLRERFGAREDKSLRMRFHAQTAGSTLVAQQPQVNVVRVTLQALAAVMGGAQSLHTNSWDEALALPTEESATLALRTQQVIAHESGVAEVVDALGGSWTLEATTDRLEAEAMELLARVDELGGMVSAIEQGWVQREVEDSAYRHQLEIEAGDRTVVGVNRFEESGEDPSAGLHRLDPGLERDQRERVAALRAARDADAVARARRRLRGAAAGTDNVMPYVVDCVRARTTLGEISDTLRDVFGTFQP